MIIPGPLEMKNSTQNTPPWQFSELYHLCNNNLKNDLFASPLLGATHAVYAATSKLHNPKFKFICDLYTHLFYK